MLDLAVAVVDPAVTSSQYRYVETHAWWLGTFGLHQYLSEQRVRQWVPAHPDRTWLLERELTGAHTWLTGSAAVARADGFDLRALVPTGRFRAPHGEFDATARDELEHRELGRCTPRRRPPRGNWQSPTLAVLPAAAARPGGPAGSAPRGQPGQLVLPVRRRGHRAAHRAGPGRRCAARCTGR